MIRRFLCWFYYPRLLHYELQFFKPYWYVRQRWLQVKAKPGLWRFAWKNQLRTTQESFAFGRMMMHMIGRNLLRALSLIASLIFAVWVVRHLPLPAKLLSWSELLTGQLSGTAKNSTPASASSLPRMDSNAYSYFVSTIAQISGTFLGLYFTAISLVLSTNYADAPDELREFIAEEKIGNRYIQSVALLAFFSLFLLFVQACGFVFGVLPLLPLAVMSASAVLGFVPLGMRTFRFFDPTTLATHLTFDLYEAMRGASPGGLRWNDPSFQDFYRRKANRSILIWEQIAHQIRSRSTASAEDVAQIGFTVLNWLSFYATRKASIPAESLWFEARYASKDWLWADYSELSTALGTDTPLQPETKRDLLSIERHFFRLLLDVLEHLVDRKEWMQVARVCAGIAETAHRLGRCYAVDEGLLLLEKTRQILYPAFKGCPPWPSSARALYKMDTAKTSSDAVQPIPEEEFVALIAALDSVGFANIQLFLGLLHQAPQSEDKQLERFLSRGSWRRPFTFYSWMLPRLAWDEWARLQKEVSFQLSVEGQILSPLWAQKQYLARGCLRFWVEAVEKMVGSLRPTFLAPLQLWHKSGCLPQGAQMAIRGLEATHKVEAHLQGFQELVAHLHGMRRVDDGLWRLPDWDALRAEVVSVRREVVFEFVRLGSLFLLEERRDTLPDFGGHAFSLASNEIVHALEEGDEKEFERLFPIVLVASVSAFDRVMKEYNERDYPMMWQEARAASALEPLKNLLAISGLALLYSEFDGKNFWTLAEQKWNEMLGAHDNVTGLCELLALAVNHSPFSPKGAWNILRVNWQRPFEEKLRAAGFSEQHYDPFAGRRPPAPIHPSALIRCYADHGHDLFLGTEPEDYFAAHFLSLRPEASNIQWSRQTQSLKEQWEEFQQWEQEKANRNTTDDPEEADDEEA